MQDLSAVRLIEERSFNAWPSLKSMYYDGWILRFANGYTRRANSVNTIYPSTLDIDEKITRCEAIYAARGAKTIFKLTPAAHDLDTILAGRGYAKDALTSVQTALLAAIEPPTLDTVRIVHELDDTWLEVFCRLNSVDSRHIPTMRQMLDKVVPERCFITLDDEGQRAAAGLAVLDGSWIGLFDIVTDSQLRGRGLGRQLVLHLLNWGRDNGARQAYLQVMTNNAPALHLYHRLGFREAYPYWYRISR